MQRLLQFDVLLVALALLTGGAAALVSQTADEAAYPTITADLEPLRAAFNADPGHVRAVLLASPT